MLPERFFETSFFDSLRGGKRLACSTSPSGSIADLWGVELAPSLARWIDFLGEQPEDSKPRLGEFYAFTAADWLPMGNAFEHMLREWFRRAALLSGTIPLGATGSGDIWLVEARRARVFLLDHDLSEVAIVADSVEAFALLCHLNEQSWNRVVAEDEWRPLAGRVRGTNDIRVEVPMLDVGAGADLTARHAAVDELLGCLWFRHVPKPTSDLAASARAGADAPALIEHMIRHFLREEDVALAPLLAHCAEHRARVVRDAASSLTASIALRGFDRRYEALRTGAV